MGNRNISWGNRTHDRATAITITFKEKREKRVPIL